MCKRMDHVSCHISTSVEVPCGSALVTGLLAGQCEPVHVRSRPAHITLCAPLRQWRSFRRASELVASYMAARGPVRIVPANDMSRCVLGMMHSPVEERALGPSGRTQGAPRARDYDDDDDDDLDLEAVLAEGRATLAEAPNTARGRGERRSCAS